MKSFIIALVVAMCVMIACTVPLLLFTTMAGKRLLSPPNREVVLELSGDVATEQNEAVIQQTVEVLNARFKKANMVGIARQQPDGRIAVKVHIATDGDRASFDQLVKTIGYMELCLVHRENTTLTRNLFRDKLAPPGLRIVEVDGKAYYDIDTTSENPAGAHTLARFQAPDARHEFMLCKKSVRSTVVYAPYFIERRPQVTGEYLEDAQGEFSPLGKRYVSLSFDERGAKRFAQVTGDYAPCGAKNGNNPNGRQLAIIVDGRVLSAPTIMEAIYGGKAQITGSFPGNEADILASILASGPLPAPLTIVKEKDL